MPIALAGPSFRTKLCRSPRAADCSVPSARGFTLMELMVVVVIIAILAAIAMPSYSDYVVRGKLVEATAGLADWRVKMEQYYQDNRHYGTTATSCPAAVPAPTSKYFSFSCNWATGNTTQYFTLTATNRAGQGLGAEGDFVYTVNQSNTKATPKFYGATVNAACWLTKKGDSC